MGVSRGDRELARFHAYFFLAGGNSKSADLMAAVWDTGSYWGPGKQPSTLVDKLESEWARVHAAFAELLQAPGDCSLGNLGARLAECARAAAAETHVGVQHKHSTLMHGDPKAANLFFRASERDACGHDTPEPRGAHLECGMIDFQWCGFGLGATEVAYLVASSVQPEALDADGVWERGLLQHYHQCWMSSMAEFSMVATPSDAEDLLPFHDLEVQYDTAMLDLCTSVIAYHWARIDASPAVLEARGAANVPCNSYTKSVAAALWLMRRCNTLLARRMELVMFGDRDGSGGGCEHSGGIADVNLIVAVTGQCASAGDDADDTTGSATGSGSVTGSATAIATEVGRTATDADTDSTNISTATATPTATATATASGKRHLLRGLQLEDEEDYDAAEME